MLPIKVLFSSTCVPATHQTISPVWLSPGRYYIFDLTSFCMERCLNHSTFIKWFEINKIVNNSAVDVTLDNLRQNLSKDQWIRILTSGIKHCLNNSEPNDTIIDDIHSAIKDVKIKNNNSKEINDSNNVTNNNVNTTKLKRKKQNKRVVMIKSVQNVFSIDNLYFNILQFLDFKSLFICASINVDWLYHVYDPRSVYYFNTNTNTNNFFKIKNRNFWPFRNAQKVTIDDSYDYNIPQRLRHNLCYLKMVKHLQLKNCYFERNDEFGQLIENNICRLESFSIGNVTLYDDFWSFFSFQNIGNIKSLAFDNITSRSVGTQSPTDRFNNINSNFFARISLRNDARSDMKDEEQEEQDLQSEAKEKQDKEKKKEKEEEEKENEIPILLQLLPKMIKKMPKLSSFTWIDKRINGTFKPIIIDEILKESCNVKYLTLSFNGKEFSDKKLNKMTNDYKYCECKLKYNNFNKLSGLTIVLPSLNKKDFDDDADETNNSTNDAQTTTTTVGNGTIKAQVKNFEKMIMLRKIAGQLNTCTWEYVCESLTIKDDINNDDGSVAEIATQIVKLLVDRYKTIINGYDISMKNNNMGIGGLENDNCDTTNNNSMYNKSNDNNEPYKDTIDRNRTAIDAKAPIIRQLSIDLSNESSISCIIQLLKHIFVLNYMDKRIILNINIKIIKTLGDLERGSELSHVPKLLSLIQRLREKFNSNSNNSDCSDCNSNINKSKLKLCFVACYDGYLLHDCECEYCQDILSDQFYTSNPLDKWMSSFKEILCDKLKFIEKTNVSQNGSWWKPQRVRTYQSPENLNEIAISVIREDRATRKIVV